MLSTHRALTLGTATAVAALSLSVMASSPASAQSSKARVVATHGTCAGATWKMKAKADNSRIEVEAELDTNRNGQTWAVKITDNGARVYSATRKTKAPSGSFSVGALVANRSGADRFVATFTRPGTRTTCVARLTY
jgi:hypothetical protein